jgi:hypothetical protein
LSFLSFGLQKFIAYFSIKVCRRFILLLLVSCISYLIPSITDAAQLTVAWEKNPEPGVAGYKIYYGTSSGEYDYSVDVGNQTICTISGIEPDRTYYFAATAYNEIGESNFSAEKSYSISSEPDPSTDPIDQFVIDNGDENTYFTGRWRTSRCPNPYGDESLYSRDQGSRYAFEAFLVGNFEVSLWWTEHSTDRCTSVPVEIYDGDTLLDTVEVNQQTDGGQWNVLGKYAFDDTVRVEVVSQGDCSTGIDALELVSYVEQSPSPSIYQITSSATAGGKIAPSGEVTVTTGSSASYTIQPDANYRISDVIVDGTSVGPVTSYTFNNVSAEHTITADFEAEANAAPQNSSYSWWWGRSIWDWFNR